ncbi:MAG: hypothetical protein RLZZ519_701 [Bacteroidota bacterium]|jgi:hypothetical protein
MFKFKELPTPEMQLKVHCLTIRGYQGIVNSILYFAADVHKSNLEQLYFKVGKTYRAHFCPLFTFRSSRERNLNTVFG